MFPPNTDVPVERKQWTQGREKPFHAKQKRLHESRNQVALGHAPGKEIGKPRGETASFDDEVRKELFEAAAIAYEDHPRQSIIESCCPKLHSLRESS